MFGENLNRVEGRRKRGGKKSHKRGGKK